MSDEEPVAPLRTTQLALLTLAAITLLLATTVPVAQRRLTLAEQELRSWPATREGLEKALQGELKGEAKQDWTLAVPDRLTPAWLSERLGSDGQLPLEVYTVKPCASPVEACQLADDLRLGCEVLCAAKAMTVATTPPANRKEAGTVGADDEAAHLVVNLSGLHALEDGLSSSLANRTQQLLSSLDEAATEVESASKAQAVACGKSAEQLKLLGPAAPRAREAVGRCGGASATLQNARRARSDAWDQVRALKQEQLVRSDELAKSVAAGKPGHDVVAAIFLNGTPRFVNVARDTKPCRLWPDAGTVNASCAASGSEAASAPKCREGDAPGRHWCVNRVIGSGAWADIKDLDLPAARAMLQERVAQAQLEGEVLGITLSAADALGAIWLPMLALFAHSCWLLFARGLSREQRKVATWPTHFFVQAAFHLAAGVAIGVSLLATRDPSLRLEIVRSGAWIKHQELWGFSLLVSLLLVWALRRKQASDV